MDPDPKELRRRMTCNAPMGTYDPRDYVYTVTHAVAGEGKGAALPPAENNTQDSNALKSFHP